MQCNSAACAALALAMIFACSGEATVDDNMPSLPKSQGSEVASLVELAADDTNFDHTLTAGDKSSVGDSQQMKLEQIKAAELHVKKSEMQFKQSELHHKTLVMQLKQSLPAPEVLRRPEDQHEELKGPDLAEMMGQGRRGGDALMTSGSFTMMSSNRAGNSEDDEEDLGSGQSSEIKQAPSNNAKCAGDKQDQRQVTGTLDCDSAAKSGNINRPKNCLDNLSSGSFWYCLTFGAGGVCADFSGGPAAARQAFVTEKNTYTNDKQACRGVVTKGAVAHPHRTGKKIGVLALKRIKCDDKEPPTCAVFKTAVCFKADKEMFNSIKEQDANKKELKAFAEYVKANAWIDGGTANAKLKESWRCTGTDEVLANGWIKGF